MNPAQLLHLSLFGLAIIICAKYLPRFSIQRPVAFTMLVCSVFLLGIAGLLKLPVELMPNYSYGNVTIYVDVRGGMPPPDVERLITKPIEEAMATVSKMKNIISTSKKHRSIVTLEFQPGANMNLATLEVREKFLRVKHKLPKQIERPVIAHYEEHDAPVVIAALTSPVYTPEKLRQMVEEKLKEKLLRTDGVANVEIGGGRTRKILVEIDKKKVVSTGLSIKKVIGVLEKNNLNMRVGELNGNIFEMGIRAIGAYETIEEIKNVGIAVTEKGSLLRLKDIADVKDSHMEAESYSRLNSKSAVTLYIQKESMTNTVKVVSDVKSVINKFKSGLNKDIELFVVSDQGKAIVEAIRSIRMTLFYGAALVILVISLFLSKTLFTKWLAFGLTAMLLLNLFILYFFRINLETSLWMVMLVLVLLFIFAVKRRDIRPAFIVAFSIPVSLAITLALMFIEGVSLNVISFSGLVLGIGLLVDNSIVVLENFDRIQRKMRNLNIKEQIEIAATQMVGPMIGGTLTTVVVFLPFSMLGKQTQILYAGIAFTVTAALLSSLLSSLSLVPALGSRLEETIEEVEEDKLSDTKKHPFVISLNDFVQRLINTIGSFFSYVVDTFLRTSILFRFVFFVMSGFMTVFVFHYVWSIGWDVSLFLGLITSCLVFSILMFRYYYTFLSWCIKFRGSVLLSVLFLFIVSMSVFAFRLPKDFMAASEKNDFVVFVELSSGVKLDISNKIVKEVEKQIQYSEEIKGMIKNVSSRVEGWSSKIYVTLVPRSERKYSTQEVIDALRPKMKDIGREYNTFIHFSEPMSGKEIFVELYGHNYDTLAKLAMQLASSMSKVSGFSDIKIRYRPGRPQMRVVLDKNRVPLFKLTNKEVGDTLHAQIRGLRATSFYTQDKEVETVVRLNPEQCKTIEHLKGLNLASPLGFYVPVEHISKFVFDLSPSEIWHRNKSRMIQVSANLGVLPLEKAANICKGIIRKISFPEDYYADIGGDYENMIEANRNFRWAIMVTLILIFIVMACLFESVIQPFIIMLTVVLSGIGAVALLAFSKSMVSLGVSIGMLMLGGIVVNNGIMLLDRINVLRNKHKDVNLSTLIIWAASSRKRPIFMTTVTTILGLLPMALDRSEASILWGPLAITVIGGLISSTIFTLFVVPCFYCLVEDWKQRIRRFANDQIIKQKCVCKT